jgi:hypothetical protein
MTISKVIDLVLRDTRFVRYQRLMPEHTSYAINRILF